MHKKKIYISTDTANKEQISSLSTTELIDIVQTTEKSVHDARNMIVIRSLMMIAIILVVGAILIDKYGIPQKATDGQDITGNAMIEDARIELRIGSIALWSLALVLISVGAFKIIELTKMD